MVKNADNIYYSTKNQVRGLCVGGDMVILFYGLFYGEMTISPPTHNPRIFGTLIDIASIFYQKSDGWVVCRRSFKSTGGLTNKLWKTVVFLTLVSVWMSSQNRKY